jgi:hypothetical protein
LHPAGGKRSLVGRFDSEVQGMNARSFDRLAHQAAHGVTRRTSLLALGAAGLAGAFAGIDVGMAKAKGTSNPCKKQLKACIKDLSPVCAGDPACLARVHTCCPFIGKCDFTGFINCTNA